MTTRRSFLSTVAGGAAAAALARRAHAAASAKPPLGLQLYSLRNQLAKDVPGTLQQVKAWGFEEVESYGKFGLPIKGALRDAGLRCRAMHFDYERLRDDMAGVLREADALGLKTVLNASLPHQAKPYASREEILKAAGDFAKWSKECRAAGKRFAYHIHGQEFGPAPEGTLFDVLAKESGPDVGFEADVYWVTFGGADPVKLMNQYPGRIWFTHLKDMVKGIAAGSEAGRRDESTVVLGTGQIDIPGILAACAKAGVEINYLEDESPNVASQIPKSVAFYRAL